MRDSDLARIGYDDFEKLVAKQLAILFLRPPIHEFGLLEFTSFDRIVAAGYDYTRDSIAAWDQREAYVLPPEDRADATD